MEDIILLALGGAPGTTWYVAPLLVVVSLVYCATRHEDVGSILRHALHFSVTLVGLMLFGAIVLFVLGHFT
jgi:hypothetical protein